MKALTHINNIGNAIDAEIMEEYSFIVLLQSKINPFLLSLDVKPRTLQAYEANVDYFIDWVKDNDIVIKSRDEIVAYKKYLIDKTLKATTINAYLTAVRRFFSWLYDNYFIERDYARGIKSEDVASGHKKDAVMEEQYERMLSSLNPEKLIDRRDYLILMLAGTYGLRGIEISRLNRCDLVEVKGNKALMLWGKGKNEADKEPHVISNEFNEQLLAFIGDVELDKSPIFTSLSNNASHVDSERLSTSGIRYTMAKRFLEVGIKRGGRISFHSLRHTAITRLHKLGAERLELRDFARHKSTSTTDIYTHVDKFENPIALKADTGRADMFEPTYNNE